MRVQIISCDARGLQLAKKLESEGHDVKTFIDSPADKHLNNSQLGRLFFGKAVNKNTVQQLNDHRPDYNIVIGQRLGKPSEKLNAPVVGSSILADAISIVPYQEKILSLHDIPLGKKQQIVAAYWFDGNRSRLFNLSVPSKRLMDGEVGPDIECSGMVVSAVPRAHPLLKSLLKLEPFFRKMGFRGEVSASVDNDALSNLNAGITFDRILCLCELFKTQVNPFLHGVSIGKVPHYEIHDGYAISVRVTTPAPTEVSFEEKASPHIYPKDLKDGVASSLTVTAGGRNIRECRRRVYRTISRIKMEDKMYRSDIGNHAQKVYANLLP